MIVSMIAAQANNRVIGNDNKMPWYLPEDFKYFKRVTLGKPIIMGRKTFESIGRPLPGRLNIVVTRDESYQRDGVRVVSSLEDAFDLAEAQAMIDGVEEVMVIGGAQIYRQALDSAQRLYITQVDADVKGDACFPDFKSEDHWEEVAREDCKAVEPNPYDYSFIVYERRD